ncbi:Adenosine 3'-phospho 5'-phosphosulfate transporter 1 (PAPS transporter 1) (Solute carrier family 35 member B2), partial [Durusdinium trenchii]
MGVDVGAGAGGDAAAVSVVPQWMVSMGTNLGLYFFLFAMGFLLIQQVRKHPVVESDRSLYARLARWFVFGYEEYEAVPSSEAAAPGEDKGPTQPESLLAKGLSLAFCSAGLLGSYLLWGVLQERVMTTEYSRGKFSSSIFLVFCNRLLALTAAFAVTSFTKQPPMRAPFYKYSFTSFSNVLSSWSQLEALKFVSFPTQVLAKSSKLIPVMLMGKLISKKSYKWWEYGVAATIGFGVAVFTLNNNDSAKHSADHGTSFSGLLLITLYLVFDSFTSQWQGHLFGEYKMSSYQMMFGVNAFSCFFTFCSLMESGELFSSLDYVLADPTLGWHILLFSTAGATGQMFIFKTIKTFGPVVFTMIMVTRQLVSIVLSCIIYGHTISAASMVGVVIVFGAMGYKIWRQQQEKQKKKTPSSTPASGAPPDMELKAKTSDLPIGSHEPAQVVLGGGKVTSAESSLGVRNFWNVMGVQIQNPTTPEMPVDAQQQQQRRQQQQQQHVRIDGFRMKLAFAGLVVAFGGVVLFEQLLALVGLLQSFADVVVVTDQLVDDEFSLSPEVAIGAFVACASFVLLATWLVVRIAFGRFRFVSPPERALNRYLLVVSCILSAFVLVCSIWALTSYSNRRLNRSATFSTTVHAVAREFDTGKGYAFRPGDDFDSSAVFLRGFCFGELSKGVGGLGSVDPMVAIFATGVAVPDFGAPLGDLVCQGQIFPVNDLNPIGSCEVVGSLSLLVNTCANNMRRFLNKGKGFIGAVYISDDVEETSLSFFLFKALFELGAVPFAILAASFLATKLKYKFDTNMVLHHTPRGQRRRRHRHDDRPRTRHPDDHRRRDQQQQQQQQHRAPSRDRHDRRPHQDPEAQTSPKRDQAAAAV